MKMTKQVRERYANFMKFQPDYVPEPEILPIAHFYSFDWPDAAVSFRVNQDGTVNDNDTIKSASMKLAEYYKPKPPSAIYAYVWPDALTKGKGGFFRKQDTLDCGSNVVPVTIIQGHLPWPT